MDVQHEINPKAFIFTLPRSFFIAAKSEASEKLAIRVTLVQEVGRHNGLRINTAFWKAQGVTDILANIHMVYFLCSDWSFKI